MKHICNKKQCTGCGLCAAQCPKHCISMRSEELGHLYPHIKQDMCVDCGLCQKSCPSLHTIDSKYPTKAYAAWAKDEDDYKSSTSGGAASLLTNYILSTKGVVYGCAILPTIQIKHIRIDDVKDAYKLKGSKYVQSSIIDVLPLIKQDVKTGRKVLFIGTPCQVAAVKQMFRIQPDNLFLVDIICHGVPSNKWLSDYIVKYLNFDKNEITSVRFRTTNGYQLCIYREAELLYQSKNLHLNRYKNLYMDTFIDGFTSRKSCNICHYAKPERISDVTIGDFWGLGKKDDIKYIPEHKYGISCILPITEKGNMLLDSVKDNLNIYERPILEAVYGNEQLHRPKIIVNQK